jgi:site-specific DNA recombinase
MRGPRPHRVVASPARCPLEPVDQSVKNFDLASSEGIITSGTPISRSPNRWIKAKEIAHTPLVSEADYVAAQAVRTVPAPGDGNVRTFLLAGLACCRGCGRRMDSHWVHGRPGYRRRHGHTSAKTAVVARPRTIYLREDDLLASVRSRLGETLPPTVDNDRKLAAFLQRHRLMIVCGVSAWTRDGGR